MKILRIWSPVGAHFQLRAPHAVELVRGVGRALPAALENENDEDLSDIVLEIDLSINDIRLSYLEEIAGSPWDQHCRGIPEEVEKFIDKV